MTVEIKRTYQEKATPGLLTVFDDYDHNPVFECKTLELPWLNNERKISCIPAGEYLVVKRKAFPKRNYDHFHIQNVPNRDWILIHIGNKVSQILGCILVGEEFKDINKDGIIDVVNSTVTLKMLYAILPEKFKLIIS